MKGKNGTQDPGGPDTTVDAIRPEAGSVCPDKNVLLPMLVLYVQPQLGCGRTPRSTGI